MRIATITNWAYGITVGLTLASGSAMLMASSADRVERRRYSSARSLIPSDEVENDAWALSDLARLYVIKPSPETLTQYQQLQQTDKSIEQRLGGLKITAPAARSWRCSRMACGSPMSYRMNSRRPRRMSLAAMRQRPSRCCTAPRTRLNWSACRRRSIASARCLSIAPPSLSTGHRALADLAYAVEIMVGLTALMFCSSSASFSNAGCSTGGSPERRGPASRLRIMRWRRRTYQWMRLVTWLRRSAFSRERPPSAAGAAARRRLGDPRAAGAYDSAAAGL